VADPPRHVRVVIVGSGPAGLTAALYTARADLCPLVIAGVPSGGQLMLTTEVENYPGFPDGILGPELMELFRKQAARFGAEILEENVTRVDFSNRPFSLWTGGGQHIRADTVILATGASALWLGLPSEERFRGKGVSSCATCDGFFFKGRDLVVVGGGDTAMEDALFLTKFATHVTIVHRRSTLRASRVMQDRARQNPKISFIWNSVVEEIIGDAQGVRAVRLRDVGTNEVREVPCGGVFVAIGHRPNTDILRGQIDLDGKGYVKVHEHTRTNVEGVFACGDVCDPRYRQAVSAAGSGCMAAMDAERYLQEQEPAPSPEVSADEGSPARAAALHRA
jgi:thioredoxin reductase (NADPH)